MSDAPLFERLAVVGMGLVGGSVALAAHERGLAGEVRGVDPALDRAGPIALVPLEEAAAWADALVLAVPIGRMEEVLVRLAPRIGPETILTDTASVKQPVAEAVRRHLPVPERAIGAHPMAGGDGAGFGHARADLFEGDLHSGPGGQRTGPGGGPGRAILAVFRHLYGSPDPRAARCPVRGALTCAARVGLCVRSGAAARG